MIGLAYLVVMNVIGFAVFGYDKRCAIKRRWRVSEKTLFLTALLGGSVGSYVGMFVFRHKTLHWKFRIGIPIIMLLQCAGIIWRISL
ncbi:MAG: DUF1294 domain-containing protein [Dorea sp.]|mgnify:FL=1|jgi:uncharacterized membrane protein YsdA (DUF1294 family)|nr:DUF1294 domain-containing protein [Dorea sp.]